MIKQNKLVYSCIVIFFLVSFYYIFSTIPYVRYWADDFCSSVLLRNDGFLRSQIVWWNGWTGRYSATFFTSIFETFGQWSANFVAPMLLTLFILPISIFLGMTPSILIVIIFILVSPNVIQSFYWMTGSLNYFAPFVFLNFYLLSIFKPFKKHNILIGSLILLVATGFSEAFDIANMLLMIYFYLILDNKEKRKILFWGMVTTFISLFVMYLAPGNSVRSATVSHPESISELIKSTLVYSKWWLVHLLYIKTFVISILTIIASVFVFLNSKIKYFKNPKLVLLLSFVFMISVTLAVVGLTYQAMNWEPPERVMSIVNNMIIIGTLVFSVALFQLTNKFIPKIVTNTSFAVLVLSLTFFVNKDWSKVKNELKTSAESPTYLSVGKLDGLEDNKGWVKSCIIEYYK